jgi:hypothetical protein
MHDSLVNLKLTSPVRETEELTGLLSTVSEKHRQLELKENLKCFIFWECFNLNGRIKPVNI